MSFIEKTIFGQKKEYQINKEWIIIPKNTEKILWTEGFFTILTIWWEYKKWIKEKNIYNPISVAKTALLILRNQSKKQKRIWVKESWLIIKIYSQVWKILNQNEKNLIDEKEQIKNIKFCLKNELWATLEEINLIKFETVEKNRNELKKIFNWEKTENRIFSELNNLFNENELFQQDVLKTIPKGLKEKNNFSEEKAKNYCLYQLSETIIEFKKWNNIKIWYEREYIYDNVFIKILNWEFKELNEITNELNPEWKKASEIFWTIRWTEKFAKNSQEIFNGNKKIRKYIKYFRWWIISLLTLTSLGIYWYWEYQNYQKNLELEKKKEKFSKNLNKSIKKWDIFSKFLDEKYWKQNWNVKFKRYPERFEWEDAYKSKAENLSFFITTDLWEYIWKKWIRKVNKDKYNADYIYSETLTNSEFEYIQKEIFEILIKAPEEKRSYLEITNVRKNIMKYLKNNPDFKYLFENFTWENIENLDKNFFKYYLDF